MKTKSLITVILLLATGACFAQESMFDKFAEQNDITCITITKALLDMLPDSSSVNVNMNGIDIKKIAVKLKRVDIFTSKTDKAKRMMEKEISQHFKNNRSYEVLMKIKEESTNISFYGQNVDNFFKSLVMFVNGDDKCVLIRLSGEFTMEDIQALTKKK
jgi:hypothetical protein